MADPLFLSLWLRGYSPIALPVYLRKALSVFPYSTLSPMSVLRIYALSPHEAPIFEEFIEGIPDPQAVAQQAQEFLHEDCAFQLETQWDLYQWDGEWELKPSRVVIEVYAPEFEGAAGEHVRVDLGPEGLFLAQPQSDQLRPVQSNIRSVLRLTQDLEEELSAERRLLWSDEEENFAERLGLLLD